MFDRCLLPIAILCCGSLACLPCTSKLAGENFHNFRRAKYPFWRWYAFFFVHLRLQSSSRLSQNCWIAEWWRSRVENVSIAPLAKFYTTFILNCILIPPSVRLRYETDEAEWANKRVERCQSKNMAIYGLEAEADMGWMEEGICNAIENFRFRVHRWKIRGRKGHTAL